MKKELCKFILLDILGWKPLFRFPVEHKKLIVIIAPHTSMMDFLLGWLYFGMHGKNANFAIKKEFFFFPLGYLLKAMGSIPVDRKKTNLIDQMCKEFEQREHMILNITPEGTRKRTNRWKKGFWHISKKSGVPLVFGYFDYKNKMLGVGENPFIELTDNIDDDLKRIKKMYNIASARFPENFDNSCS